MRVRQQTPSGDMTFGASQLNFLIDSPECVAQVVKTSLQLWQGEWSFDTSQGLPYLTGVIGKYTKETADQTIQNYVLGIQGVTDITAYVSSQDRASRNFIDALRVQTQFSKTDIAVLGEESV